MEGRSRSKTSCLAALSLQTIFESSACNGQNQSYSWRMYMYVWNEDTPKNGQRCCLKVHLLSGIRVPEVRLLAHVQYENWSIFDWYSWNFYFYFSSSSKLFSKKFDIHVRPILELFFYTFCIFFHVQYWTRLFVCLFVCFILRSHPVLKWINNEFDFDVRISNVRSVVLI